MRLPDITEKIKQIPDLPKDIFVLLIITLVAFGAFLGGGYATQEETRSRELKVVNNEGFVTPIQSPVSPSVSTGNGVLNTVAQGMYVGSKTGKTYHLPWCSGARRIKDENRVWFQTKSDAELRGYMPATNCVGI